VQRREIDLLGGDELIVCIFAYIFDVLYNKRITQDMLGQQYNLGTPGGEPANYCFADAAGTALHTISVCD